MKKITLIITVLFLMFVISGCSLFSKSPTLEEALESLDDLKNFTLGGKWTFPNTDDSPTEYLKFDGNKGWCTEEGVEIYFVKENNDIYGYYKENGKWLKEKQGAGSYAYETYMGMKNVSKMLGDLEPDWFEEKDGYKLKESHFPVFEEFLFDGITEVTISFDRLSVSFKVTIQDRPSDTKVYMFEMTISNINKTKVKLPKAKLVS